MIFHKCQEYNYNRYSVDQAHDIRICYLRTSIIINIFDNIQTVHSVLLTKLYDF